MIKTKADLIAFIQKAHQEDKKTFREITLELKKMGYKSPKTQNPLLEASIRQIAATQKQLSTAAATTGSPKLLTLIESVLDIEGMPAQAKIDLIRQLRQGVRN